jgi:Protein of unknown function (DUF2001).
MSELLKYHKNPISLREGKVFIDGIEVYDLVKCEIKFTPDVWTGRQLGDRSASSRWLGYSITGSITRRRTTPWLKNVIQGYMKNGKTPEFTIQGIMNDEGSEYYANNGSDTVTVVGVVLTGDLSLISLDAEGQVLDDVMGFNAKAIV